MWRRATLLGITIILLGASLLPDAPAPYRFPTLAFFPEMPGNAANPVTEEGVALGRYLFYDPVLSVDSSMSCGSCHRQAAAFSDAPNAFGKDRYGAPLRRNTPPLFNLAWYPRLFWDGRAGSPEEQVLHPVRAHEEMNLQWPVAVARIAESPFYRALYRKAFGQAQVDSAGIAKAIAQFERTLLSYRSKYDRVLAGEDQFTPDEYDGFEIVNDMSKGDCLHCHTSDADALGVRPGFSNNGLDRDDARHDAGLGAITGLAADSGKFKVPSLRNIALTTPYMHDGRFRTLAEVLDFYSTGLQHSTGIDSRMGYAAQGGVQLSTGDKRKVIAFLHTLTDSAFVRDPAHSNPWKRREYKR